MTRPSSPTFTRPLRRRGEVPLHRQLYERVRDAILRGVLKPGARLPSARAMALEMRVARGTVDLALQQLASEGYLVTRGAAGTFVSDSVSTARLPEPHRAPLPRKSALDTLSRTPLRPFQIGVPAVDAFPLELWSRLLARRSRAARVADLVASPPQGEPVLREAIAAYVTVSRGVACRADQVIITAGFQGALGLVARALLRPGDTTWIEDPGYPFARNGLALAGMHLAPIPVDDEGIDVAFGVEHAPRGRLAVVTPGHQMPLGVPLSLARRLALIAWARRAGAFILEDDYDGEFHYDAHPLPALQSLDGGDRVIYTGTFSKVMFPALRLGFLVAPEPARETLDRAAALLQPASGPTIQRALADFLQEGHFARHIRRMRLLYAERRDALLEALEAQASPDLQIIPTPGGLHVLARLREGLDDSIVAERARAAGLEPVPLSFSCATERSRRLHRGLLLAFPNLVPSRARDVVARLRRVLDGA
jgi:GntR family transcriptional regulator/MocR family aminotransferase